MEEIKQYEYSPVYKCLQCGALVFADTVTVATQADATNTLSQMLLNPQIQRNPFFRLPSMYATHNCAEGVVALAAFAGFSPNVKPDATDDTADTSVDATEPNIDIGMDYPVADPDIPAVGEA